MSAMPTGPTSALTSRAAGTRRPPLRTRPALLMGRVHCAARGRRGPGPARAGPTPSPPPPARGLRLLELAGGLLPQGAVVSTARAAWRAAWVAMVRELAPQSRDGAYERPAPAFTGVLGSPDFPVEAGRYRLYIGNACPWCHRVAMALTLRGLGGVVAVTTAVDAPERASRGGWAFDAPDPAFGARDLRGVYDAVSPGYVGRCTAPLLVDVRARRAVSNDSAGIVAALDAAHAPGATRVRLRPADRVAEIDALNDWVYSSVANGVYRCGFATTQAAYDAAAARVRAALAELDARLAGSRFLLGPRFTDADLRLFPAVARLDAAYGPLFRAGPDGGLRALPHLHAWARDVWRLDGGAGPVSATLDVQAARESYFRSLFPLNPSGIVPAWGGAGLDAPPDGRGSAAVEEAFYLRD